MNSGKVQWFPEYKTHLIRLSPTSPLQQFNLIYDKLMIPELDLVLEFNLWLVTEAR